MWLSLKSFYLFGVTMKTYLVVIVIQLVLHYNYSVFNRVVSNASFVFNESRETNNGVSQFTSDGKFFF